MQDVVSAVGDFVLKRADGLWAYQLAVVVDDVPARHAELIAAGYEPLHVKEFKSGDELLARFFFILDPDGYKIEVLEKHGHYR